MEYALLNRQRDGIVWNRPEAERERIVSACFAHSANLAEQGGLAEGPFAETKDQLAGFDLIRRADPKDAVRVAADIIRVQENFEGAVEVRSVLEVASCGETTR